MMMIVLDNLCEAIIATADSLGCTTVQWGYCIVASWMSEGFNTTLQIYLLDIVCYNVYIYRYMGILPICGEMVGVVLRSSLQILPGVKEPN